MVDQLEVVEILEHRRVDGEHEFDVRLSDGSRETRRAQLSVEIEHRDAEGRLLNVQEGRIS